MSDRFSRGDSEPPAEGPPPSVSPAAAQAGMLIRTLQDALRDAIANLRDDVREIKSHQRSDFRYLLIVFGAGFIAIVSLFGWGYSRIEDRLDALDKTTIKIDTKLEDLLQRIPPAITTPQRR